jgi:rhodanese-related sulfurtransferase
VEEEGWRFVAFVRLMPLIPFNLLNYALGLTRIPLLEYAVASVVCMAPGTLAYTWLGHAGREVVAGQERAIHYGLMGLALLVAVAFLPRLVRRLKSEEAASWIEVEDLAARLEGSKPIAVIDVRGHDEFAGPLGHIANARNMPLTDLARHLDELGSLIETPVVLVCKTDKRSANAAALLGSAGFRDVVVLRGGMVRWNEAKMPVAGRISFET